MAGSAGWGGSFEISYINGGVWINALEQSWLVFV